ncbi:MAG: membrane protein insertion efficiency factor YidD [Clostridiales bacterium]|nr:membrane protein insertion efficiency factor YidD [Clostridiales bacterium]
MLNRFFIFLIKLYKKYLSKGLNSGCIFTPTCSVYAVEALQKYSFFKAFALIIYRILRCNSLNKGGFDPVPDPKSTKKWLI